LCFGAIFIAIFIGFLLGALGTHLFWVLNDKWENYQANEANRETCNDVEQLTLYMSHFNDSFWKQIEDISAKYSDAKNTQAPHTCDGDDNKDNQELATCKNDLTQLNTTYNNFKLNIKACSNKLNDIVIDYEFKNGKEWSEWCIQEWKKQGDDTSPLSKPIDSMDITEYFNKLHSELNELMKLLPQDKQ
jgi:hypothetical protein